MSAESALSEAVVFDLPHPVDAERLCERLRHRWHGGDEAAIVTAELRLEEGDLAALLRAV